MRILINMGGRSVSGSRLCLFFFQGIIRFPGKAYGTGRWRWQFSRALSAVIGVASS